MSSMTHGSLFSGVGGFDLGAQMSGIKTIWNCECEEDLPAGTTVIILKIVGNHFIVKEKEKK